MTGLLPPPIAVEQIDRTELNRLLIAWGHRMGPYARPSYAIEAHHALFHHGEPVAVTAAAESIGDVIGDTRIGRFEVVELARLCAARPHLCRPMLRLWREFLFPDIAAAHRRLFAVSYQDEALHTGGVYRHDGWARIGKGGAKGRDRRGGRPARSCAIWGWPREIADTVAERKMATAA